MAATQGRLTGRPGVCLATLGPGALNLTTGAAFALLGAMPMIMITGQKGILSRKQGRFQVVDIVATIAPLTKIARQIVSPATIPTTVREAFRLAPSASLTPQPRCTRTSVPRVVVLRGVRPRGS
jgi:acetolactate synthase-1/2/3 large subunit